MEWRLTVVKDELDEYYLCEDGVSGVDFTIKDDWGLVEYLIRIFLDQGMSVGIETVEEGD